MRPADLGALDIDQEHQRARGIHVRTPRRTRDLRLRDVRPTGNVQEGNALTRAAFGGRLCAQSVAP